MSRVDILNEAKALPPGERATVAKEILGTLCRDAKVIDRIMRRIENPDVPEDVWRGIEDAEDAKLVDMEIALFQAPPGQG